MERRLPGRTRLASFRPGRALALALAAVLMATTGLGASASPAPARWHRQPTSAEARTSAIADLALDLEFDPEKIFRFVADEIRYEPYAGILRGALGTLDARAGNSVDRALLLAALLEESGILYRFARGPLDEVATARIVDAITTDAAGARAAAMEPLRGDLDERLAAAASATGPLAALYRQQDAELAADARERFDLAGTRLVDTVRTIEDALSGAGIALPEATDASLPAREASDHTWVQMASGPAWVDLDPTLPASQPGTLLAPVSTTVSQLPDELRYKVEFDVLIESVSGGQLATQSVLTYSGFADELVGVPVMYGHVTPSGVKTLGLALGDLVGEGWLDYRPTLQVGDDSFIADRSVAFPTGRGADIFGTEPSPSVPTGPIDGEATAEWLEVLVIPPPGGEPTIARRTVFDRLPGELRVTGRLTPGAVEPIELVDADGSGRQDYLPMLGNRTFVTATGPTSVTAMTTTDDPFGNFALAYQNVRDAILADAALDAGARSFIDGPNIVSASVELVGSAPPAAVQVGLDIWHRSHGILPLAGSHLSLADSRLVAGIADHVAERFAIDALVATAGRAPAAPTTIGVGDIFDGARAQGIPTVFLQDAVPDSLPYGPIQRGLIAEALADGEVVVAPSKPVTIGGNDRVGWWRIDPATGAATDVMDTGAGTAATEQIAIIKTRLGTVVCRGYLAQAAARAIFMAVSRHLLYGGDPVISMVREYQDWRFGPFNTTCR